MPKKKRGKVVKIKLVYKNRRVMAAAKLEKEFDIDLKQLGIFAESLELKPRVWHKKDMGELYNCDEAKCLGELTEDWLKIDGGSRGLKSEVKGGKFATFRQMKPGEWYYITHPDVLRIAYDKTTKLTHQGEGTWTKKVRQTSKLGKHWVLFRHR